MTQVGGRWLSVSGRTCPGSCRASASGRSSGAGGRAGLSGWVGNDAAGVVVEAEGPPDASPRCWTRCAGRRRWPGSTGPQRAAAARRRRRASGRAPATPTGARARWSRPTPPPAPTACASWTTRPTGGTATRSSTAPNCGPRFTIVATSPTTGPRTTMAGFPMCADCAGEYDDPADRRFHAQPVCCPACGPPLRLLRRDGAALPGDPSPGRARCCAAGAVVAVKGLGGYHLAVDARQERRGRRAARPQAPRGPAVRGDGRRPRRGRASSCEVDAARSSRCSPAPAPADRPAAPAAARTRRRRARSRPAHRRSGVMLPVHAAAPPAARGLRRGRSC